MSRLVIFVVGGIVGGTISAFVGMDALGAGLLYGIGVVVGLRAERVRWMNLIGIIRKKP